MNNEDKEKGKDVRRDPAERFFHACLLVLGGAIALGLALQLISQIWPWLVLAAVVGISGRAALSWWRARRQRW